MSKPIYTLIAGINGAGKTSLYWTLNHSRLGERINIDEIVKAHGEHINVISTQGVGSEFIFSLQKSLKETEED